MDCILSSTDLPRSVAYTAADATKKPRISKYWWEVGEIVQFNGEPRFPTLTRLMMGL